MLQYPLKMQDDKKMIFLNRYILTIASNEAYKKIYLFRHILQEKNFYISLLIKSSFNDCSEENGILLKITKRIFVAYIYIK